MIVHNNNIYIYYVKRFSPTEFNNMLSRSTNYYMRVCVCVVELIIELLVIV